MRSVGGSRVGEARPAGGDLGLTGGEAHPDMTKHGDVVGSGALARRVDCWPVFPRELAYRYSTGYSTGCLFTGYRYRTFSDSNSAPATGTIRVPAIPDNTGKKTPGGAGTLTRDTQAHTRTHGSHRRTSQPSKPNDTPARPRDGRNRGQLNSRKNSRRPGADRSPRPTQKRPPPACSEPDPASTRSQSAPPPPPPPPHLMPNTIPP